MAQDLDEVAAGVEVAIQDAVDAALAARQPAPETATWFVYSPDVDPTSE